MKVGSTFFSLFFLHFACSAAGAERSRCHNKSLLISPDYSVFVGPHILLQKAGNPWSCHRGVTNAFIKMLIRSEDV